MTPEAVNEAVALFRNARQDVSILDGLPESCRPATLDEAYRIQKAFVTDWHDDVVGWKVGATNQAALALFGMDEPFLGPIFGGTLFRSPVELRKENFQHYCLESEFAFRMKRTLPARAAPYSHGELLDAVSDVIPVFELICPRFSGIPKGDGSCAIADCGLGGGLVLGGAVQDFSGLDLAGHQVSFSADGEQVASGTGALVMGHPLNALAWTVSKLGAIGLSLEAGQIVTTGTCTGVNFVKAGQHAVADFGGLGKVEAQFV